MHTLKERLRNRASSTELRWGGPGAHHATNLRMGRADHDSEIELTLRPASRDTWTEC